MQIVIQNSQKFQESSPYFSQNRYQLKIIALGSIFNAQGVGQNRSQFFQNFS